MTKQLRVHKSLIKLYPFLRPSHKYRIIDNASEDLVNLISECCLNFDKLPESSAKASCLKRHKKCIQFLRSKKESLHKRKRVLKQKGGSFLSLLFSAVAPLVSKLFG